MSKDSLLPTSRNRKANYLNPAERVIVIKTMEKYLEVLQPTPLNPIKALELWKKWGPLLKKYASLITCSKPSNEIIDSIKEINLNKTQEMIKRKRGKVKATSNTTSIVNDADSIMIEETSNITAINNDAEAVMSVNI